MLASIAAGILLVRESGGLALDIEQTDNYITYQNQIQVQFKNEKSFCKKLLKDLKKR